MIPPLVFFRLAKIMGSFQNLKSKKK